MSRADYADLAAERYLAESARRHALAVMARRELDALTYLAARERGAIAEAATRMVAQ